MKLSILIMSSFSTMFLCPVFERMLQYNAVQSNVDGSKGTTGNAL